jgi:predicted nuclease of predicted toxin-antitoxin system
MKLLIDANMSLRWVLWLEEAGFSAVHWSNVGPGDASDLMIMEHARDHGYVILTLDLDFGIHLAASRRELPSVIQVRIQYSNSEEMRFRVIASLQESLTAIEEGALITVTEKRLRIRPLPIG